MFDNSFFASSKSSKINTPFPAARPSAFRTYGEDMFSRNLNPFSRVSLLNVSGEENDLKIRVWGDSGGIEWKHSTPNTLLLKLNGKPNQIYRSGVDNSYLSEFSRSNCRTPSGHPEGFIEAFANIYRNFSYSVNNYHNSRSDNPLFDYPTVEAGYRGMKFIDAVIESSKSSTWIKI